MNKLKNCIGKTSAMQSKLSTPFHKSVAAAMAQSIRAFARLAEG